MRLNRPGRIALMIAAIGCLAWPGTVPAQSRRALAHRWLFVWRDMSDPKEVDRVIARLPRAKAAGYNGVALSYNVAPERAPALREAAKANGLDLIAIVMGGSRDRNYAEGTPVMGALFVVKDGIATHVQDIPTTVRNGGFEEASGDRCLGWQWQDDEGVTTFVDREVKHGGQASLRMENISRNANQLCRIMQPIVLRPFRQYHISVWVRTEGLSPANPEVKVLSRDTSRQISFQTFRVDRTQDWKRYDIVFNSFDHTEANLYLGSWGGKDGRLWWDDLSIDELGLVNVLRRPGCPVTVRGDRGMVYEEGKDYEPIRDPLLHPWIPFHEGPVIRLKPGTAIREGEQLRVDYYHPILIYEDRLTSCISEPKIFEDWREEVRRADELLSPAAFFMSHDEMRVMNWCWLCRSRKRTPGQLLADNVRRAASIIREHRPDAGIWVWSDMFDPMHNAVDGYYAVNGSLKGSWEGLAKDVGIVNWHGGLMGKNCRFFADLGLKQILSGYYDTDDTGEAIVQWQAAVRDVPGIIGAMYTTWEDKYEAMGTWASKAWGGG